MTTIRVDYHRDTPGWWADSPDLSGFVASGNELSEVRALVHEGVPFYLEDESVEIREHAPWESGIVVDVSLVAEWLVQAPANWSSGQTRTPLAIQEGMSLPTGEQQHTTTYSVAS